MPVINKPNQHFNVVTYTGTGSSGLAITGVGFKPDIVWIKSRSDTAWHILQDSNRGSGLVVFPNRTDYGDVDKIGTQQIQFDTDGFTLIGSSPGNGDFNTNGNNYVAWCWKTDGTKVTNNTGTISTQVSVNQTAGISIITYTGNGSAGATIGHGLGAAPYMLIAKARSTASGFHIWHTSISNQAKVDFTTNALYDPGNGLYLNSTTPNSTVVTLGTSGAINENNTTYVMYCFAEVAGYSKFGSYTGNGSTNGPFIYTGFRPRFVLVKLTSSGGEDWALSDGARDPINVVDSFLAPNASSAEATGSGAYVDYLSNGFKVRTDNPRYNGSSGTYIYMAFAEAPFKFSNAR